MYNKERLKDFLSALQVCKEKLSNLDTLVPDNYNVPEVLRRDAFDDAMDNVNYLISVVSYYIREKG